MRSAASAARCASSVARSTPLRWSGSSWRRSRPTGGSTRSRTGTRNWPAPPASQEEPGEFPRADGPEHPAEPGLALDLPSAVPQRRAVAGVRGDEQRLPAHPPGPRPPARGQVRLHVLSRWPADLPETRPDRDRRLPDVLLRPVVGPRLHEHPRHPEPGAASNTYLDIRADDALAWASRVPGVSPSAGTASARRRSCSAGWRGLRRRPFL